MRSTAHARKASRAIFRTEDALSQILSGTGFTSRRDKSGAVAIVRRQCVELRIRRDGYFVGTHRAAPVAATSGAALETVTVTSSKIGGDVQNIPISITALSQEQLTATQTAGGPDLVKQVPNMTFTKTNFSGYSIQIRGIGTQAISVTTDPAVAVAFNDIPFIRNHFFEQEFYDVSARSKCCAGRKARFMAATRRRASSISFPPNRPINSRRWRPPISAIIGNRRLEGMINIPIVDDRLDMRVAGEWTKRQGYSFNEITDEPHRWPRSVVGPRDASA